MRLARVFVQEYPGRQIGSIHDVIDSDNHPGSILSGILAEVEVPEGMDERYLGATVENGEVTLAIDAGKMAAAVAAEKQAQVTAAYNHMNDDVYGQMEAVFGTKKSDSATAFEATFRLMVQKPELFSGKGLSADKAVGDFTVGQELDTDQKVVDYATARIAEIEAYAVYRMNRIKQFYTERAQILGG